MRLEVSAKEVAVDTAAAAAALRRAFTSRRIEDEVIVARARSAIALAVDARAIACVRCALNGIPRPFFFSLWLFFCCCCSFFFY